MGKTTTIGLVLHPPIWKNWLNKYSGEKNTMCPPCSMDLPVWPTRGWSKPKTNLGWFKFYMVYICYNVGFLKSGTTIWAVSKTRGHLPFHQLSLGDFPIDFEGTNRPCGIPIQYPVTNKHGDVKKNNTIELPSGYLT